MISWVRYVAALACALGLTTACASTEQSPPEGSASSGEAAPTSPEREWVFFRASTTGQVSHLIMHHNAPRTQYDRETDSLCAVQYLRTDRIYLSSVQGPSDLQILEVYVGDISFESCIAWLNLPNNTNPTVPYEMNLFGWLRDDGSIRVVDWKPANERFYFGRDDLDVWNERFDVDALVEAGVVVVR